MSRKAPFDRQLSYSSGAILIAPSGFQRGARTAVWCREEGVLWAEGEEAIQQLQSQAGEKTKTISLPPSFRILPTGFDLQVHLRYPGQESKETLEGALESALAGGFDGLVTMPNTNPFLDTPQALKEAIASSRAMIEKYPISVGFAASATKGMLGQAATDVKALVEAGAVAITDDGWGVKSPDAQKALFEACAKADVLFQQHAEMPGHRGVTPKGRFQERHHYPFYPREAESEMVKRDLQLLREHPKARYHVLHVSTSETLPLLKAAKAEGLAVTAEVTPHHLIFCQDDIPEGSLSTFFKMNPPLFHAEDRSHLREALESGLVDCVSTDHAPHEGNLKALGWTAAPFGTRGLETSLASLLHLHQLGLLSWKRLVESFSYRPREILGRSQYLKPRGALIVNLEEKWQVSEADLPGISSNSCFIGYLLNGRIAARMDGNLVRMRSSVCTEIPF
jgi:dihydroorotase